MTLRVLAEKSAPRRPGYGHFLSWTSCKESPFYSQRNHADMYIFNHIPFISGSSNAAHDQMNHQTLKHRKSAPEESSLMFPSASNVVDMESIYTAERRRRIISSNIIKEMKISNSFMAGKKRFNKPSELNPLLHGSGNLNVRPYSHSAEEVVVVTNENEDSDIGTLGANQTGEIKLASDGLANSDGAIGSASKTKETAEKLTKINGGKALDSEEGMCIRSAMDSTNQMTEKIATKNGTDGMVENLAATNNVSSEGVDLNATQSSPMKDSIGGSLPATKAGEKPRIVVLGTGWAASRLMKDLNTKMCDIVCVSPRNHMVFTPLLASTCVGTLEFRSVAEPIVRIQPALSESPDSFFFLGRCLSIDPQNHEIHCIAEGKDAPGVDSSCNDFTIAYDKLVIAAGAQALTFNIQGVAEHAIFLREVTDAQKIRKKLLLNLMLSDIPGTSEAEKRRLLHCVVVGGGPTGVEFSGELSDFIRSDVHQRYSHVKDYINVTLIEAKEILSSFDVRLRIYAMKHLEKAGVKLVQGVVKDVQPKEIILSDGSVVPYGLLVWSTGVGPSSFVKSLQLPKSRVGRIGVDENLRVSGLEDVYAIGDCAGFVESVGKPDLPALAQVAERQGKYLASELNRILKAGGGQAGAAGSLLEEGPPFVYRHLGSMASVGRYKALVDLRENKDSSRGVSWAGFLSWLVWRSAYLTRVVSWRNRFYVAVNWATTFIFGRDISRI